MFPSVSLRAVRSTFTKLACLTLVLGAATTATAQTPVVFGDVITEPGLYFLAGNQSGSVVPGVTIESDDVSLFLGRFKITGDQNNYGILSIGNDNVSIFGGRITNCEFGILMIDGRGCTVKDVRIDNCVGDGLIASSMRESWFLRMQSDHNGFNGVNARECDGSRFLSVRSHDNDRNGFLFAVNDGLAGVPSDMLGSKVRLSWAAYNGLNGIHVRGSESHELVQNQCVGNDQAGIRLGLLVSPPCLGCDEPSLGGFGAREVLVKSNWCVFNRDGILIEDSTTDNTLTNNTALANSSHDMVDDNDAPPCENAWYLNFFFTKDGAGASCIF